MYRDLVAKGVDMLKLAADRAHKYGIKLLPTSADVCLFGRGKQFKALSRVSPEDVPLVWISPIRRFAIITSK